MSRTRRSTAWDLELDGVEIVRGVLDDLALEELRTSAPEGRAGVRNPLPGWSSGKRAAEGAARMLHERFARTPTLTRAILFDKRADANWHLPLHRDVSIAVRERADAPGYGPWSVKDGVPHVEPPHDVLASMVTVRLHVDASDELSGCLRVVPGSHLHTDSADTCARSPADAVSVVVRAGDAVLMKPLVLHGSERSRSNARRRVLHLEFAFDPLPAPLAWAPVELE